MFQKNNFGKKVKEAGDDFKKLCELAGQIENNSQRAENERILVGAMAPLVTCMDMVSTALESLRTWTAHNFFVQHYAETKGINSLNDAVSLMNRIRIDKTGGEDAVAAIVASTNHLVVITNDTSLEDLKKIAKLAIDVSSKGVDNAIEDSVIAAAMERNLSVDEVVSLAESFLTNSGTNHLILAYVKKWGVNTPAEAKSLYRAVESLHFGGNKAIAAIIKAAEEKGISPDEFKPKGDFDDFMAKMLTEIFTGGSSPLKCFLCSERDSCPNAIESLRGTVIIEVEKGLGFNSATELREKLGAIQKKGGLESMALKSFLEKKREKFEAQGEEGNKIIAVLEEFIALQSSLDS